MTERPILSVEQMREADRLTIEGGTLGIELMEEAGRICAEVIAELFEPQEVLVLCGPGNNGGDGFVIARHLEQWGWDVRLACEAPIEELGGDAVIAAGRWHAITARKNPTLLKDLDLRSATLFIDAMFGTGLARNLEGHLADIINRLNGSPHPVVAIDMPSGICGDTGRVLGAAVEADLTVSLAALKRGQVLMPGRLHCGDLIVADIGISDEAMAQVRSLDPVKVYQNEPGLWDEGYPWPDPMGHKYTRGHLLVASGPALATGASRLAAMGALRTGAGLVTLVGDKKALKEQAPHVTAIMLREVKDDSDLARLLEDPRKNAVVIGPGHGVGEATRLKVAAALRSGRAVVLDADALTSFEDEPEQLFAAIKGPTVLTPHRGEFARLFGLTMDEEIDHLTQALAAAKRARAVVVLKGPDTIIASPDDRIAVNVNAPPWLATAGSGDVLAGMIGALMAQGMPPFEAASAGVWLHAEAANELGLGLIAEDLPLVLPEVVLDLLAIDEADDDL
ncbi:MAG: NAD(P)H-hydrate dehydratase [Alphaproteobacteria bacterium]|nr:MAG: NAD(P)H-hydrate dehydratase [Alphaproteobacteria bacterium]